MNLFAELAASQIRVNRSRTFWTLAAIALATALITCVTHFVASGAEMIATSVGGGLTQYSAAYRSTLVIPAAFLSLLIVVMAVVVISNVFRVSARERTAVFGTLKCVGATPAQIRKTMLWEALLLAGMGIPLGLVLGLGLTAGGIAVANHFFDELNALTHIMLQTMTFRLDFVLSPLGLVSAALLALATVLISAWLPARKAAKQSAIAGGTPIDALQQMDSDDTIDVSPDYTSGNYIALRVSGRSMEPQIADGAIAVIRLSNQWKNGAVMAVYIDDYTATLKKVRLEQNGILMLQPFNPEYETRIFTPEEQRSHHVTPLGVLVEHRTRW